MKSPYSYPTLKQAITNNIDRIEEFDVFIGIGSGGWPAATELKNRLSDKLDKQIRPYSIGIATRHNEDNEIDVYQWLPENLKLEGERLFLVEDMIDSGRTLKYVTDRLLESNPESISVFLLQDKHVKREYDISPEVKLIICEEIDDVWIVYDWEVESLADLNICKCFEQ